MALSTKSPMPSLQQDKGPTSANSMRATVTGVDSGGQLFRDSARIVYLKGQKCVYHSRFKPSPDASLMVEFQSAQNGKETWRSNAKIKHVSPMGPQQDAFRVTVELDRAHPVVIDAPDMESAEGVGPEDGLPSPAVPAPAAPKPVRNTSTVPVTNETTKPDHSPAPAAVPAPPSTHKDEFPLPSGGASAGNPIKPSPMVTPAPKTMITDIVRSVMASDFGQLGRQLESTVSNQVEAALREHLQSLETKMEHHSRSLVSSAIDAAVRGPVSARIDTALETALETKMEQHFRTRPAITEETVRRLAVQAAENVQLQWATTKLQKLVAEAVRQPLEAENEQRGRQVHAVVSSEIEAAVRGPVAAQMDTMLKKALEAQWAEYVRSPLPITEETVRQIAAASVAEHPQFQSSIDALAAKLGERLAEAARDTSVSAQQDLKLRMAATERLANQVVSDIQDKLNSFGVGMERIFARPQEDSVPSSPSGRREPDLQDREKRLRDVLQSAGSQFEREMKAALQKIFGNL
jgi:predicted methyltransferase MtxX (methanogen marker protein 4)